MSSTIYLISGANRGIGLALVKEIISTQPSAVVFAGTRDTANPDLQLLSKKHPDNVHVVKLVSADVEGNQAVAKEIQDKYERVDIVIANAGIGRNLDFIVDMSPKDLLEHVDVNVNGPLVLFKAMYPLLRASPKPKFLPISSASGSIGFTNTFTAGAKFGSGCYGASKAALNYITHRIHLENEWLICFPISPGGIRTELWQAAREMDTTGAVAALQDKGSVDLDEGAQKLIQLIVNSTREEHGGKFVHIDGSIVPW